MSQSLEGPKVKFKEYTGRETELRIVSETLINSGNFGKIYDSVIEIGGLQRRFIVKKYSTMLSTITGTNAEWALKNYSLAKKAGLRVFPTFRISKDRASILMTTGFFNDKICVASNDHYTVDKFGRALILEIENIDEFLSNFFTESLKAAQQGIQIHFDVFFFILNKNEPTKIDFVLGDLDNLYKAGRTKETGVHNMNSARDALHVFFTRNTDPIKKREFLSKVENSFSTGIVSVMNSTLK